jgi:RNA polymerase sigma factor (TIGR02999 family)
MTGELPADLTKLLNRMLAGEVEPGNQAMDAVYAALKRIASSKLRRERPGHLLDTRALVHEAIIRLFGSRAITVKNRQHFFALVCLLMTRVLIDRGRRKEPVFAQLEESMAVLDATNRERLFAIDRILERFNRLDPTAYKAIELQLGAGMTLEEMAAEMSCSTGTVNRSLRRARAWLYKELEPLMA